MTLPTNNAYVQYPQIEPFDPKNDPRQLPVILRTKRKLNDNVTVEDQLNPELMVEITPTYGHRGIKVEHTRYCLLLLIE